MRLYAALGAILLTGLAIPAAAQAPLPKEGSGATTSYFTAALKTMPMGSERTQGTYEAVGVVTNDAGQGFLHNASIRCVGSWHAVKGEFEEHGACLAMDRDGDQVFTRYRVEGGPGRPAQAKSSYVGGTGKYAGIQGTSESRRTSLRPTMDGTGHSFSKASYSYRLP